MQDLLGGQVDLMFDGMGSSAAQIRGNRLKALAVTTEARSPAFPDIPTMKEAGVQGYVVTTWYGLWAPAGTPADIVNRMQQEVAKAMQSPLIRKVWEEQGAQLGGNTPAEFGAFVRSEVTKWADVAKVSGARVD